MLIGSPRSEQLGVAVLQFSDEICGWFRPGAESHPEGYRAELKRVSVPAMVDASSLWYSYAPPASHRDLGSAGSLKCDAERHTQTQRTTAPVPWRIAFSCSSQEPIRRWLVGIASLYKSPIRSASSCSYIANCSSWKLYHCSLASFHHLRYVYYFDFS